MHAVAKSYLLSIHDETKRDNHDQRYEAFREFFDGLEIQDVDATRLVDF